jgi:hypothetical protein
MTVRVYPDTSRVLTKSYCMECTVNALSTGLKEASSRVIGLHYITGADYSMTANPAGGWVRLGQDYLRRAIARSRCPELRRTGHLRRIIRKC